MEKINNYPVFSKNIENLIDEILNSIKKNNEKKWLACFNPHSYVEAKNNNNFKIALESADWLVPDGIGVVIASYIGKRLLKRRITGYDLFIKLLMESKKIGHLNIFLLGSTEKNLKIMSQKIQYQFGNISVVGQYSPPFKSSFSVHDIEIMVNRINNSNPDILLVGLTAPKQELFIFNNLKKINIKFACGIGAVFDFYTGNVPRPNKIFRILGLEWLSRLIKQPRKIWRRVFISTPIFFFDFIISMKSNGK